MNEIKTSTYFGVIPASVRYDKSLPANAKLLYSELTCLANKEGYCYASNNYFATLYDVDSSTVSKWINKLSKEGYVTLEYIHNGSEVKERRIYIAESTSKVLKKINTTNDKVLKKEQEGVEKSPKGYCKKTKDNNTSNNNTSDNNNIGTSKKFHKPTLEEVKEYIHKNNYSVDAERFIDYYKSNGWKVGKNPMKDWKACVRTWNKNTFGYTKKQNAMQMQDHPEDLGEILF